MSGLEALAWVRGLVGIPELARGRTAAGADCLGIVILAYRAAAGIELPDWLDQYGSAEEFAEIHAAIGRQADAPSWREVDLGEARMLDVLVYRIGRYDHHVGVWIKPGWMLHMARGDCAKCERLDSPYWASRFSGLYRWRGLA